MVLVPGLIPPPCRHYRVRCSGCLRTSDPDLRSYTPYIRPSHYHRWVVRAVALRDAAPAPPPSHRHRRVVRADALRDAACLACCDARLADEVKQAGLAWKGEGRGRRGAQRIKSTGWYCLRERQKGVQDVRLAPTSPPQPLLPPTASNPANPSQLLRRISSARFLPPPLRLYRDPHAP